jgi:hypothetical protein
MKRTISACAILLAAAGACLAQGDSVSTSGSSDPATSGAPAGLSRWEIGVRTTGLNSFPGAVAVGWFPVPGWLLNLDLDGYYSHDPRISVWQVQGRVDVSLGVKRRLLVGQYFDLYLGVAPGFEYQYAYVGASGGNPDRWYESTQRTYDLSLALQASVRRQLPVWGRRFAVELGCSPVSAEWSTIEDRDETYDRDDNLVASDTDWTHKRSIRGTLNASAYLGIAYRF